MRANAQFLRLEPIDVAVVDGDAPPSSYSILLPNEPEEITVLAPPAVERDTDVISIDSSAPIDSASVLTALGQLLDSLHRPTNTVSVPETEPSYSTICQRLYALVGRRQNPGRVFTTICGSPPASDTLEVIPPQVVIASGDFGTDLWKPSPVQTSVLIENKAKVYKQPAAEIVEPLEVMPVELYRVTG